MANTIAKNRTAKIPTKSGKDYSYQYTDLASINKWLDENGLDYYQEVETNQLNGKDYVLTYRFINGEWEDKPKRGCQIVDATLLGVSNPAQQNGSALTYARRYSLCLAFGLATEDDDGAGLTKEKEVTEEYAKNYVFEFGKHNGEKLTDVIELDDGYIQWLLKSEKTDADLLKSIEILTGQKPKEYDLELTQEFQRLLVDSETDLEELTEHYGVENTNELSKEQLVEAIGIMKKKIEKRK